MNMTDSLNVHTTCLTSDICIWAHLIGSDSKTYDLEISSSLPNEGHTLNTRKRTQKCEL